MGVIELLTMAETVALLKTTKQQVRKMIAQQLIPAMKIGRKWRVSKQYLEVFLKSNMVWQISPIETFSFRSSCYAVPYLLAYNDRRFMRRAKRRPLYCREI